MDSWAGPEDLDSLSWARWETSIIRVTLLGHKEALIRILNESAFSDHSQKSFTVSPRGGAGENPTFEKWSFLAKLAQTVP
jgi:hypothetical protein